MALSMLGGLHHPTTALSDDHVQKSTTIIINTELSFVRGWGWLVHTLTSHPPFGISFIFSIELTSQSISVYISSPAPVFDVEFIRL